MNPNADCPPHPRYGKPLSGKPETIDGVTFRPYRTGVLQYAFISDDFRIEVRLIGSWYRYGLDGGFFDKQKFRNRSRACAVGVAQAKKTPAPAEAS